MTASGQQDRAQQARCRYLSPMPRLAAIVLFAALLALPVATAGARPVAQISKSCHLSTSEQRNGLGVTTYVLSVSATHIGCGKAKGLVKAFHTCRHKNGKAGRCPHVKGYSCTESRISSPTQYDSKAICKKGSKVVRNTYTQNT
jgi:hypothetical protein